jgi:demethylmenaquinone methyltransferase/2-methoxy-6-polyprenyl-1,4-benzoquinol methylase
VKAYYEARAPEYDDWWLGLGRFDGLERPRWDDDVRSLERAVAALPPARTLDVACGTGFLTRHLRGEIVGVDQSRRMLEIARARVPHGTFVRADALAHLPFADGEFDRVFTGHFYGHLEAAERGRFLIEARRLANELVVVDSAVRPDRGREEMQERILNDGSRWRVYKRYFTGSELADELGGGDVLHESRWFVVVRA